MTAEPTYTLGEAKRELQRQTCAAYGHSWSVIEVEPVGPVALVCDCGDERPVGDAAEVTRLLALIDRAPHAGHCEAGATLFPGPCNCWKREARP